MRLMPKSFLVRTILMIFVPLIIVLTIVTNVFFENHWKRVHETLARTLTADIVVMMDFFKNDSITELKDMAKNVGINVSINKNLNRPSKIDNFSHKISLFNKEIHKHFKNVKIYLDNKKRLVFIDIKNGDNIVTFATSLYRLYSNSVEVFIIWIVGALLIVSVLITPFIILHNRSIRRIAKAANYFGRGLDYPEFEPSGSKEVREAALSMILMKDRLKRYNKTRSDMLNAISHDLKSPLSRVRLAIETGKVKKEDILKDIDRMTEMLNAYLSFAKGELPEIEQKTELTSMLIRIARDTSNNLKIVTDFPNIPKQFYARPMSLSRAFTNIIENAVCYAKTKIKITEKDYDDYIEILIEDDGNGIKGNDLKQEALKPFVRLDNSRACDTGGTGLGLSIARTIVQNHGGDLLLEDSDLGGLKVKIIIPV